MGVFSNFVSWLFGPGGTTYTLEQSEARKRADTVLDLKLLMMASAAGYLAAGLSMCRWRVITGGREDKGPEYFRLNNRPNPNQNKSEFCAKLIWHLATENEAVIFSPGRSGDLYVADSWNVVAQGTGKNRYNDVTLENQSKSWSFGSDEVMHLKMHWQGLYPLLCSVAEEYEEIMTTAYKGYARQTGAKGVLNIGAVKSGNEEQVEANLKRVQAQFKKFYDANSAVLTLPAGQTYTPLSNTNRNTSEINDLINLTDEFAERLGLAMRVPVSLLKGNAENTEHARTDLITYGIAPLARMIEQEYCAKRLGEKEFIAGSRLYIDATPIQLAEPKTRADFCERMTSCGQYSIDELRDLQGEPLLGTPEAQRHYITKNYGELGAPEGAAKLAGVAGEEVK